MPKISVIIPTFNRAHTLSRAIDSVLAQSYDDFDLWIVDDGSTDNTESIVVDYNNAKIRYHKIKNSGVSSARNFAIERSNSQWKAFLDSDDEWLPHKLQRQIDLVDDNQELKIVHGEEIWIRNGVRVNQMKKHQKYGGRIFQESLPLCLISPSAVMIHQDVFDDVGTFDPEYTVCEDYDLWLKITCRYEIGFIADPLIKKYGGHEDQLSHQYKAMDYWRVRSIAKILTDHREHLSKEEVILSHKVLLKKCTILLKGYRKHDNMAHYQEIDAIRQRFCDI